MLIGIDGNEANVRSRVGVNQYAFQLLKHLEKLDKNNSYIIYLSDKPLKDLPPQRQGWKYETLEGRGKWIIKTLTPHLLFTKNKPDIFFSPSHYAPIIALMPLICSIMDLGYLENSAQFPKGVFWQLKYWSAWSILISKKIITISKASQKDILRHYNFARKKTHVTYLAHDKTIFNTDIPSKDVRHTKKKYKIDNYFLYFGTLKPSKNIEGIITAYSSLPSALQDKFKLVIAGKKGWLFENIFQQVKKAALVNNIVFTDYISEIEKPSLIKGARALLSPSFTEGFGIHVLESMAVGTPVIVSNTGSIPEVAGKAGIYVNPHNTSDIAMQMSRLAQMNPNQYNILSNKSIIQASKYSWEKTAKQTIDILESAAK